MYIVHQQILKVVDNWSIIATAETTLPQYKLVFTAPLLHERGNIKEQTHDKIVASRYFICIYQNYWGDRKFTFVWTSFQQIQNPG